MIRILYFIIFLFFAIPGSPQGLYTPFPSSFKGTKDNELCQPATLHPFFQKIHNGHTVKVMQIGDSHVRGNFLPRAVGDRLQGYFNQPNLPKAKGSLAHRLSFTYYGINGAWAHRFYEPDMIQKVAMEHPDLVIISFGTNEAHGNFQADVHTSTISTLLQRISEACPGVTFLLTTPPGSYISKRTGSTGRGRHRRYTTVKVRNERTEHVARNIVHYGETHHIAVWDIFTIAGGPLYACTNWRDGKLMQADCIHYLATGYQLQGNLLADAIIKAYEGDAASGTVTRMLQPSTPKEQKPNKTLESCSISTRHGS